MLKSINLKTYQNQQLCLLLPKNRKSINELGFEQLRRSKHIIRVSVANQVLHPSLSRISVSDEQKQQKGQTKTQENKEKEENNLEKR